MSSHKPSRSDPTSRPPQKSGLTRELEKLGRTRGSSATPVPTPPIVSPTPQRGLQKQIDRMSSVAASGELGREPSPGSNRSLSSTRSHNSQGGQGHSPRSASGRVIHHRGGSSDAGSGQHSHSKELGTFENPMTKFSTYFQSRLLELKQTITETPELPGQVQERFGGIVSTIGQEFNTRQRPVQQALDDARNEQLRIQNLLDQAEARILAANHDRDRSNSQLTDLRVKKQQSMERVNQVVDNLTQINNDLLKKLEFQEEQLKGKRALWMEKNPGSSARKNAMNATSRDPFNSPSDLKGKGKKTTFAGMVGPMGSIGSPTPSMGGGGTGSVKGDNGKLNQFSGTTSANASLAVSPLVQQTGFGSPPVNETPVGGRLRRRGAIPSGNPAQFSFTSTTTKESILEGLASLPTNTEPGSPDVLPVRSLLTHGPGSTVSVMDDNTKYKDVVGGLYNVIDEWCTKYTSIPNLEGDRAIATSNEVLWAYMMNCTYPGHRQDAHAHVMTLLQDSKIRYLFCMRMAISYCVREIMSIDEFNSYSPETGNVLSQCKNALSARGLANEVRQTIIDRQTKVIEEITIHKGFAEFRNTLLLKHTKQLRDMLGPLLNTHISRQDAGKALGRLASTAFDVSVALHTSSRTFQIFFPETNIKFMAATMDAKDQPNTDPMILQLTQVRLKLVVTPVVTMRDDRGTAIRVKNLHKAQVITMG